MNPADTAFIILCATFVMLMTPALALFYGGLVRSKNILSTCMHSYASLGMVSIIWALFGYSLAFSGDISGLIGNLDHVFLMGVGGEANGPAANLPHNVFMAFQCMFAALTVALISGAYAERIRFSAMLVFSALWTVFAYCPMAHWVWGGGWMAKLGAVDFAGGAVVHMASAAAALACAHAVGPRADLGKTPMIPNNLPMTLFGGGLLWFGWFGFNAGSALGANGLAASAFIATQGAAAAAAVSWVVVEWILNGKPTILGAASGCIAGLVAITPAAGFVAPIPAIIIGAIGGVLCYFAVAALKTKLGYDDSLDAFGIHGLGGTWGSIATGLWATTEINPDGANGLFYGETHLLFAQIVSTFVAYAFAIVGTIILYKIVNAFTHMRADKTEEITGLDITEHGERAYNHALMSAGSPFDSSLHSTLSQASTIEDIGIKTHTL